MATPPIPELAKVQQLPITHLKIKPRTTSIQLDFGPRGNRAGHAADAE